MLDLLALIPTTPADWALLGAVVLPWLVGAAALTAPLMYGAWALLRAAARAVTRRPAPPAPDAEPERSEQDERAARLLAAIATATRERDDALRQLAALRRTTDDTLTIHYPETTRA